MLAALDTSLGLGGSLEVASGVVGRLKHVEAALLVRLEAGLWPDEAQRPGGDSSCPVHMEDVNPFLGPGKQSSCDSLPGPV